MNVTVKALLDKEQVAIVFVDDDGTEAVYAVMDPDKAKKLAVLLVDAVIEVGENGVSSHQNDW